jgi:hypothetical protein
MANSDDTYEKWRNNAAQQWQDDRYTGLWNDLVDSYNDRGNLFSQGVHEGLVRAYSRVTGDSVDSVHEMVARAARELVPS